LTQFSNLKPILGSNLTRKLDTKFLKLHENTTDIKLLLSRISPQLNFLIILNFESFANFPVFPENEKQKTKSKIL
jgi:hypothetical protein